MRIHNYLPQFVSAIESWKRPPTVAELSSQYYSAAAPFLDTVFGGAAGLHSEISDLDWESYRVETVALDPRHEEARVLRHLERVESLFGFKLSGDIVLFGAFASMDGYARFEQGSHCVYLGVDESHGRGAYLDVLTTHELTHVARESRASVWEGFGLPSRMTNAEFTESQPVIEHVFGEGFSCAVSEMLCPNEDPWHYAYQTEDSLARVLENGARVDEVVRAEILAPDGGDYGRLYNPRRYGPGMPGYTHYVWGWQWAKRLLAERAGGAPRKLVDVCSKEFVEHALGFRLGG